MRSRWHTHIRVIWEEFNKGLFTKLRQGLGKPQRIAQYYRAMKSIGHHMCEVVERGKRIRRQRGLCEMDLSTRSLTLGKTSPRQPHSNGKKCHTLNCFSLFLLMLVCNTGQTLLQVSGQRSSMVYSEEFSFPGYSRVDKSGEWI